MNHRLPAATLLALALAVPALAQPVDLKPAGLQPVDLVPMGSLPADKVYNTTSGLRYKVENVATGLQVPWAMAFDPAGRILLTERKGRVRVIENGNLREEPLLTLDNLIVKSETGLMGLCLHPDYARNKQVYLAYGYRDDKGKDIRVVRYTDKGDKLVEDKVIVSGIEAGDSGNHGGCAIAFGPDGKLYITTGEHFDGKLAQDMSSLNGKTLRVNDDGSVPGDNPFAGANRKEGARPEIWASGNRNPQGFDWTADGAFYMCEHGPSGEASGAQRGGGDEFNMIEKGRNYGWPVIHHDMTKDGMEPPLKQWTPAIAPAGGAILKSDLYGDAWKGNFFMAALGGLRGAKSEGGVYRIELKGKAVGAIERLVPDMGRIRAVAVGPDGLIYFSTSNKDGRGRDFVKPDDDRICRIVPVK